MYTPLNPSFNIKKMGFKGVKIIQACFRDVLVNTVLSLRGMDQHMQGTQLCHFYSSLLKRGSTLNGKYLPVY